MITMSDLPGLSPITTTRGMSPLVSRIDHHQRASLDRGRGEQIHLAALVDEEQARSCRTVTWPGLAVRNRNRSQEEQQGNNLSWSVDSGTSFLSMASRSIRSLTGTSTTLQPIFPFEPLLLRPFLLSLTF